MEDNKRIKKQIASERVKQIYKKKGSRKSRNKKGIK